MSRSQTPSPGSTPISGSPSGSRASRLLPLPAAEIPAGEIYADLTFPEPQQDRPYTAINMVSTVDGRVTVGGRAGGIGGQVDRAVMRILRSRVDAVMVGAGTVRSEKINLGLPDDLRGALDYPMNPLGVVLSRSGDVPLDNLAAAEGERLLFVISEEAPREAEKELSGRGEVRRALTGGDDHRRAVELLWREYGVGRLLVEGGPSLNHALIQGSLADELFLTLAPKLSGGAGTSSILSGGELEKTRGLSLISVYESGGEMYLRYSLGGG